MNLYYFKDQYGNFGDDLNPWIWYTLYPEIFTSQVAGTFLGMGTLINDKAPKDGTIYVGGSGVGYHGRVELSKRWKFVFVRGPKSAAALDLPKESAITDPAILVSKLVSSRSGSKFSPKGRVSFMPHHASSRFADWRGICKKIDIDYLDPADDIHQTIHSMQNSEFVIAEAMHGAIVADALRIPWMPVKCYSHILDFKWQDWCESLDMIYRPHLIDELWDAERFHDRKTIIKSNIKHRLIDMGIEGSGWTPPIPKNNSNLNLSLVVDKLNQFKVRPTLSLSSEQSHRDAVRAIGARMDEFVGSLTSGALP